MSMINDALKRAQQKSPSVAPGPQLRPAEPSQFASRSMSLMTPVLLVLALLIGVFFLWLARQKPAGNSEPVKAKMVAPEIPVMKAPATKTAHSAPPVVVSTPKAEPPHPAAAQKPAAPAVVAVAPPPTPVKLQAIFYAPGHSSAIINGKTVRAGDALKEYRVRAITSNSATLVSATRTIVLTLAEQ